MKSSAVYATFIVITALPTFTGLLFITDPKELRRSYGSGIALFESGTVWGELKGIAELFKDIKVRTFKMITLGSLLHELTVTVDHVDGPYYARDSGSAGFLAIHQRALLQRPHPCFQQHHSLECPVDHGSCYAAHFG